MIWAVVMSFAVGFLFGILSVRTESSVKFGAQGTEIRSRTAKETTALLNQFVTLSRVSMALAQAQAANAQQPPTNVPVAGPILYPGTERKQ